MFNRQFREMALAVLAVGATVETTAAVWMLLVRVTAAAATTNISNLTIGVLSVMVTARRLRFKLLLPVMQATIQAE